MQRNRNWGKIEDEISDLDSIKWDKGELIMAAGRAQITGVANQNTTKVVNFGKTFPSPPVVTLTAQSSVVGRALVGYGVNNITKTGFTLNHLRTNTTATIYHWTATWTEDMDY